MQNDSTLHAGTSERATAFVGRERELVILRAQLDRIGTGAGQLTLLVGEAGVGKTRLAREFAEQARQHGALVLSGCAFEGDWQPPYGPWVEALGDYARTVDPDRLRRQLGLGAAPLVQLVPQIRAALPDTPLPAPLSPDEERVRLYDAVIQLLLTAAEETPVILLLDDMHWADHDSLRLLRHAARFVGRARLLLLGIYREPELRMQRPNPLPDLLAVLRRETDYQQITVHGLSYDEVAAYLSQATGEALPPALVQTIHAETNGNAFYVREILRHVTEEGNLQRPVGHWSADLSPGQPGVAQGMHRVVGRRMARLSHETQTLLRAAAGFTGSFAFPVLQALTALPEEALLAALDQGLEAGLLRVEEGPPPAYAFAHAIVRHTLYEELNPDRRARLHRRIALALEEVCAGRELEHAAELAEQYHASATLPEAARGVRYALAAADQAKAVYARERALSFLHMARDLSAECPPAETAEILRRLALAEAAALLLDDAPRTAEQALAALAEAGAEPRTRAAFLAEMARRLKEGGAPPSLWEPLLEQGLCLVGQERDLLWARLTLLRDRFEPLSHGSIVASRWLGLDPEAVAVARDRGDEDDYARTLSSFQWRTRSETAAVLALARAWRRPRAIMRALEIGTRDLVEHHAAFREAAEHCRELLDLGERYGSIPVQAQALCRLAMVQFARGELQLARQSAQAAHQMILRLGAAHWLPVLYEAGLAIAFCYWLDGDWQTLAREARRYAANSELAASRQGLELVALARAAFVHARAGNAVEAHQLILEMTPLVERIEPTAYAQNLVIALAAHAVWDLEALDHAPIYRRLAHALMAAGVDATPLGPPELTIARMAALLGAMDEAETCFARARGTADASGWRHFVSIADYDEALALVRAGSTDRARIAALLDAARSAFQALGMDGWVRRAMALQEKMAPPQPPKPPAAPAHPDGLTARELDVLRLVAAGKKNGEIAGVLVLSVATVERHITHIYGKIHARGRVEATAYALRHGLVSADARQD